MKRWLLLSLLTGFLSQFVTPLAVALPTDTAPRPSLALAAGNSHNSTMDETRGPSVFVPGTANSLAAGQGFAPEPDAVYDDIIIRAASCDCFWDWCVYNPWSWCAQMLCYEYGC
jgi:hypothetical protein